MGGEVKEDQVVEYQERLLEDQRRAEPPEVISAIHMGNEAGGKTPSYASPGVPGAGGVGAGAGRGSTVPPGLSWWTPGDRDVWVDETTPDGPPPLRDQSCRRSAIPIRTKMATSTTRR